MSFMNERVYGPQFTVTPALDQHGKRIHGHFHPVVFMDRSGPRTYPEVLSYGEAFQRAFSISKGH